MKLLITLSILCLILAGCSQPAQFTQISMQEREEIISKLMQSEDILAFSKTEFDISPGSNEMLYVAIKNTDNPDICFKSVIKCIRASSKSCGLSNKWFSLYERGDVGRNETGVYPVVIHVPENAEAKTYFMKYELFKLDIGDCANTVSELELEKVYQVKEFLINVK